MVENYPGLALCVRTFTGSADPESLQLRGEAKDLFDGVVRSVDRPVADSRFSVVVIAGCKGNACSRFASCSILLQIAVITL